MTDVRVTPDFTQHGLPPHERQAYGMVLSTVDTTDLGTMLIEADLDWTVEKAPLVTAQLPDGTWLPIRRKAGMVAKRKDGTYVDIDTVGKDYQELQHKIMLEAGQYLIDEGWAMRWAQAGHVDYRKVFGLLELDDTTYIADDPFARFLKLATLHDGSGSVRAVSVKKRYWCANQSGLIFAANGGVISIKHVRSGRQLLNSLADSLTTIMAAFDEDDLFMAELTTMTNVGGATITRFVEGLFPDPHRVLEKPVRLRDRGDTKAYNSLLAKREGLRALIEHGPSMHALRERGMSRAVLLHAAVEWKNFYSPVRGKNPQDARAKQMLDGLDMAFMRRAADLVVNV